jgi:nitrate reductase gamma subunit
MTENNYLKDISEIKDIMHKSTRFMSLSGLSGILAGIYALIGAFVANMLLAGYDGNYMANENMLPIGILEIILIVVGFVVAFLSFITGFILTKRRAKKNDEKIWTPLSKQLILHFLIPMVVGGILILLLVNKGYYGLVAPLTLIFYGLALVSASKYTLSLIKYLGLVEILLGLLAFYFFGNGLIFWALGFGVLHIVYGAFMHFKLEK